MHKDDFKLSEDVTEKALRKGPAFGFSSDGEFTDITRFNQILVHRHHEFCEIPVWLEEAIILCQ